MNKAAISEMSSSLATLVQYIEVWHLAEDGQSMVLHNQTRLRGNVVDSGTSDRSVRNGEGLAGMAWNQRHAVILQEAPSDLLERIGAQNGLELTALVAYPIMKGHDVLSVVVFGISDGPGAIEVWSRDDRDELSISASYYFGLKSVEFMSRYVRFPKGAGLPGTVWKTGQPKLAVDLPHNSNFMRSFTTDEAILHTGLGLPVGSTAGHSDSILLLLSSYGKPIASAFEIWLPTDVAEPSTQFQCVAADWNAIQANGTTLVGSVTCDPIVASALRSGRPEFSTDAQASFSMRTTADNFDGIRAVLAIPVYKGSQKFAVVVMVF